MYLLLYMYMCALYTLQRSKKSRKNLSCRLYHQTHSCMKSFAFCLIRYCYMFPYTSIYTYALHTYMYTCRNVFDTHLYIYINVYLFALQLHYIYTHVVLFSSKRIKYIPTYSYTYTYTYTHTCTQYIFLPKFCKNML